MDGLAWASVDEWVSGSSKHGQREKDDDDDDGFLSLSHEELQQYTEQTALLMYCTYMERNAFLHLVVLFGGGLCL